MQSYVRPPKSTTLPTGYGALYMNGGGCPSDTQTLPVSRLPSLPNRTRSTTPSPSKSAEAITSPRLEMSPQRNPCQKTFGSQEVTAVPLQLDSGLSGDH